MISLPRILFASVAFAAFCMLPHVCHAQTPGYITPEDYYIFEYYLQNPPLPPDVVQEGTVSMATTHTGSNRISRSFQQINQVSKLSSSFTGSIYQPVTKAGSMFDSLSTSLHLSNAQVEDETLGGKGKDRDAGILLSALVGDDLSVAFGYSHNRYRIGGPYNFADSLSLTQTDYEQQADSLDLVISYFLNDNWSVGFFINQSWIDIEDVWLLDISTLLTENVGDSFSRWGGGLLVSVNLPLGDNTNIGITNTLTSMNKSSIGRFFDDEDSAWLCMIDCNQAVSENMSLTVFVTAFNLLDREPSQPDGSYLIPGLDLSYRLSDSTSITIGYSTTMNDNDRDEERLNLGMVMEF